MTCVLRPPSALLGQTRLFTWATPCHPRIFIQIQPKWRPSRIFPLPSNLEKLRSFLGLAGYYRKFIPDFATASAPLTALTKKHVKLLWTDQHQNAFQTLQQRLCSAPFLAYPNFGKPFVLQTDASDVGLGAVLAQSMTGMGGGGTSYCLCKLHPISA